MILQQNEKKYPNCFDFPNGPNLKTYFGNLAIQPSLYVSRIAACPLSILSLGSNGAVAAAAHAADLADDPFAVVTYCVWPYNMQ